jgi:hypothetical protein
MEIVTSNLLPRSEPSVGRPSLQSKLSLPSRIAVIGNYLPRQCGIATFTTDLCAAISAEYGTARLLALPDQYVGCGSFTSTWNRLIVSATCEAS